jgi:hypothetical protein
MSAPSSSVTLICRLRSISGRALLGLMDTASSKCPRLSHMVSGGRKGAGEEPALRLSAKVFFLFFFVSAFHLFVLGWMVLPRFSYSNVVFTGVQSPLVVLD